LTFATEKYHKPAILGRNYPKIYLYCSFTEEKQTMRIWVDADACPNMIKDILFRAAMRVKKQMIFVSNQPLRMVSSPFIKNIVVQKGFDVADNKILEEMSAGELVITADIPLAAGAVEKGGFALNPRGELYTESNIKERLSVRNFSDTLRSSGVATGGPAKISQKQIQTFANALDSFLTKNT
jgi:uncharacterized protein YaiI (UPF0178 family)